MSEKLSTYIASANMLARTRITSSQMSLNDASSSSPEILWQKGGLRELTKSPFLKPYEFAMDSRWNTAPSYIQHLQIAYQAMLSFRVWLLKIIDRNASSHLMILFVFGCKGVVFDVFIALSRDCRDFSHLLLHGCSLFELMTPIQPVFCLWMTGSSKND